MEYLPHIEQCSDCGTVLLAHDEYRQAQEAKRRLMAKIIENAAVVREGDLRWLGELYTVLIDSGIPCKVIPDTSCTRTSCRDTYRLLVSAEDIEKAQECIEEYFMEIHPEIRASRELINQGRCPACGTPVGTGSNECPDCGLTLVVSEDMN